MSVFARKRSRPAVARKSRHNAYKPISSGQQVQQLEIRRILRATGVQTQLAVGQPNDQYEQEADRVANQVMRMSDTDISQRMESDNIQAMYIQRLCNGCEEETAQRGSEEDEELVQSKLRSQSLQCMEEPEEDNFIQTKETAGEIPQVSSGLESRINNLKSGGQALAQPTRNFFEPRFGNDFSGVRIHQGGEAADISRSINARAFTLGNNIVFGAGEYQPDTQAGKQLLGHELTHVVQQSPSRDNNSTQDRHSSDLKIDNQLRLSGANSSALHRSAYTLRRQGGGGRGTAATPPAWLGSWAANAVHVKGDIWNIKLPSLGGDSWVGSYDQLSTHIQKQGFTGKMEAAHIVGGEHLDDIRSGFTYNKAPCIAVDKSLHSSWTKETTDLQTKYFAGRTSQHAGRTVVTSNDLIWLYKELYKSHPELKELSRNIVELPGRDANGHLMPKPTRKMPRATSPMDAHTGSPIPKPTSPMDAHIGSPIPKPASPMDVHIGSPIPKPASPMDAYTGSPIPKPASPMDAHTGSPILKPKVKLDLSAYPPDGKGPILGHFNDGAAIRATTATVSLITTAVSIGADVDISALGFVEWHFKTKIKSAWHELESKYPNRNSLLNNAGIDQLVKNYDAAVKRMHARRDAYQLALAMTVFTPADKVEEYIEYVHQRYARMGGGAGNWQHYLDSAEAYLNSAWQLQEQLGDHHWVTLPAIASDIHLRASTLTQAGTNLEQYFYELMGSPLGMFPLTYYPLWDLYRVANVLKNLGAKLEGLASTVSDRANEYQRLWTELERGLDTVFKTTERLSNQYRQKIPTSFMSGIE